MMRIVTAREQAEMLSPWREAVWRDHPWIDADELMVHDMIDPKADIQFYLRGPEDAYDEYDSEYGSWEQRVHDHPSDPTPIGVDWFHATSADLPVGTILAPHKGKVPWLDNPYHGGLDNRANWTWVEYDLTHSDEWLGYMVRDHGEGHLYKVKPHIGPFPWNGDASEGWVTDYAVIVEHVRDSGGQKVAAFTSDPEGYHIEEMVPGSQWHAYDLSQKPDPRGWKYTPNVGKMVVQRHENQPFVHWVSVHPDHQGNGLGQAMWERAGRPLHVPGAQTDEGKAWADKVGGDNLWWQGEDGRGNMHLRDARIASDVDDILDMLGPSPGAGAKPPAPAEPPDPDRYYNHLKSQPDRTHTAHAWLPTDVVDHYREYDRPTNNADYDAVKRAVGEDGVKLPLWISANDTHGMLVEGNNRLKAAKELGIGQLPVRFTYNHNVMRNEGTPVPHHPAVAAMMPQIKAQARTAATSPIPEFPQMGHQIPDAPGPMKDDYWGGGGCGPLALAFKNMWPDLKIGADIDNKDGTVNHAWVHDGKRAHDFMGTHPDPHGPSGAFSNFTHHEDMDPAHLASIYGRDGINWSPEEPWGDGTVNEAADEIQRHWLNLHYNSETGETEHRPPAAADDDWDD